MHGLGGASLRSKDPDLGNETEIALGERLGAGGKSDPGGWTGWQVEIGHARVGGIGCGVGQGEAHG